MRSHYPSYLAAERSACCASPTLNLAAASQGSSGCLPSKACDPSSQAAAARTLDALAELEARLGSLGRRVVATASPEQLCRSTHQPWLPFKSPPPLRPQMGAAATESSATALLAAPLQARGGAARLVHSLSPPVRLSTQRQAAALRLPAGGSGSAPDRLTVLHQAGGGSAAEATPKRYAGAAQRSAVGRGTSAPSAMQSPMISPRVLSAPAASRSPGSGRLPLWHLQQLTEERAMQLQRQRLSTPPLQHMQLPSSCRLVSAFASSAAAGVRSQERQRLQATATQLAGIAARLKAAAQPGAGTSSSLARASWGQENHAPGAQLATLHAAGGATAAASPAGLALGGLRARLEQAAARRGQCSPQRLSEPLRT